jgi:cysteine desulfurase
MKSFLKKMFDGNSGTRARSARVYLDYAGATELSGSARSALLESFSVFGNPSGIHKEGVEAGLLLDRARALCAQVLNAHAYEIYFVGSGTESCNLAVIGTYLGFTTSYKLQATSCPSLPHIITSSIEHPAVLEPIQQLEREGKVRVTYLPVYENGIVKVNDVREALCEDTILVSVMYANNEIGTLQPVKEIGRAIEEWKKGHDRTHTGYPYFHIDACQAGNYCNLDVVRLRAHLMTVNSSKVYGPKGIALLYKREGISLSPVVLGGGQERGLRSGTEAVPLAYSFGIALTEAQQFKENESDRLRLLRDFCKDELSKVIVGVTFYGAWDEYDSRKSKVENQKFVHDELRLPNNINCRIPGISSEEMIIRLDTKGFAVSHKSACSSQVEDGSYVIRALGASDNESKENIRITLGRSTIKSDIEKLVQSIKEIRDAYAR